MNETTATEYNETEAVAKVWEALSSLYDSTVERFGSKDAPEAFLMLLNATREKSNAAAEEAKYQASLSELRARLED
jgi:hypothetical protein